MPRACGYYVHAMASNLCKNNCFLHSGVVFNYYWLKLPLFMRSQTTCSSQLFQSICLPFLSFGAGFLHTINSPY
jgi:hypothetical protein